jgi:hypothetical protein
MLLVARKRGQAGDPARCSAQLHPASYPQLLSPTLAHPCRTCHCDILLGRIRARGSTRFIAPVFVSAGELRESD